MRRHYLEPAADGALAVLAEALADRTDPRLDDAAAARVVKHLLAQDRLTLLVDAIDQTLPEEHVGRKLQELHKFLHAEGRHCRAVVAGRPYAVDRYWNCLFHDGPWRFAQSRRSTRTSSKRIWAPNGTSTCSGWTSRCWPCRGPWKPSAR